MRTISGLMPNTRIAHVTKRTHKNARKYSSVVPGNRSYVRRKFFTLSQRKAIANAIVTEAPLLLKEIVMDSRSRQGSVAK